MATTPFISPFISHLISISQLIAGIWLNRDPRYPRSVFDTPPPIRGPSSSSPPRVYAFDFHAIAPRWHKRELRILWVKSEIWSPDTHRFHDGFLSKVLRKYPFSVEVLYGMLVYCIYHLTRLFTSATSTAAIARAHAEQTVHLEHRLQLFSELPIHNYFLRHPLLLRWANEITASMHMHATIIFLVGLFYYTTTRNRLDAPPAGPRLYEACRRAMVLASLVAFDVATIWPCMPPRLLVEAVGVTGEEEWRTFRFSRTVPSSDFQGASSLWNRTRYAAMPSLQFAYALLIGLTIFWLPLASRTRRRYGFYTLRFPCTHRCLRLRLPSRLRLLCCTIGLAYPAVIFVATIATANHFVLDTVVGAVLCAVAWKGNKIMLNLLPVEDSLFMLAAVHKPERETHTLRLMRPSNDNRSPLADSSNLLPIHEHEVA